jgi:Fic family protein
MKKPASIFNRIKNKIEILNNHRPLSPQIINKLKEQFALEMTYNSNAIEGNKLTLKETYLVVGEGITVKGKSLKDHLEAKNHYEAIQYLYELIEHEKRHTLSEQLIRSIHQLIVKESDAQIAGNYRTGAVMITGSKHRPPSAIQVPILMNELILWVKKNEKKLNPIELASIFHHKITHIHPFFDGNGRTARLAMNILLMQKGFPLVIILKQDRKKYYSTLEKADKGNLEPLTHFIAQAIEKSLNIYLSAIGASTKNTKYLTLSQIAKKTPYSEKYLNLLARKGMIDAHKDGRNWVSSLDAIKIYMNQRERLRRVKK